MPTLSLVLEDNLLCGMRLASDTQPVPRVATTHTTENVQQWCNPPHITAGEEDGGGILTAANIHCQGHATQSNAIANRLCFIHFAP
jgi:hypothetical protein